MKYAILLLSFCYFSSAVQAQKIDSIYFHLYTDSLKKGFYNYINVDGKTSDGRWMPLSSQEIKFIVSDTTFLRFQDNDLFIDSSYKAETVRVKAVLKANPAVWRDVVIYIRKRGFDEPLPTDKEIFRPGRNKRNNYYYSLLN